MPTELPVRSIYFRPKPVAAGIIIAVFGTALAPSVFKGGGWFWDAANALGFASFAVLLVLFTTSSRPVSLNLHKKIAYTVVVLSVAHALMILTGDPAAMSYVKAGAPVYMWAGILGLLLFVLLTYHGMPVWRRRLHARASQFAPWHRYVAITSVVLSVWHIVGSGYYLRHTVQVGVFIVFVTFVVMRLSRTFTVIESLGQYFKSLLGVILIVSTAFVVLRNGVA